MKKLFLFAVVAAITLLAAMVFASCQKEATYYTVTLNANGGTLPGEATIVVAEGETVPDYHYAQPPEGCTFTGWYRDAKTTAEWDMYADVVTADIILRSTTASPDELAAVEAAGVTLIETPIALDAFVFLKNRTNPVRSLTLDEIRKIYTGRITDWSQVGGRRATITPYSRPRNSGSEEAFRELVMKDADPAEFPEEQLIRNNEPWSMARLMWELAQNQNGIGYIFKNYKEKIMRRYEPVFAIDGIAPNAATMRNGSYPLTTKVYAIIRTDLDHGSMAYKLYEWLRTDAAKLVLEECGFLPY